jgi:SAM-dependent methyltransferase
MTCRNCGSKKSHQFLDLGSAPHSNAYVAKNDISRPEIWYPLNLFVCGECWLVQMEHSADREQLFSQDYAYFSSFSTSWLSHAEEYVDFVSDRFELDSDSTVVEVAANDGYLLQYFQRRNVNCYGIEPTKSTADAARSKGLEIVESFFGAHLATELVLAGRAADLVVSNNVLAHVPDMNDFTKGVSILLKSDGVATFEFPHLLSMIQDCQFDTVYHEHFSYLSFYVVNSIFANNGLSVFDVEKLSTHGGSLRVYAQRTAAHQQPVNRRVISLLEEERAAQVNRPELYQDFQSRAEDIKNSFLSFLITAKNLGKNVVAYGAAAKGNSLLNFSGIRSDLIAYVVDKNPAKQGKYLPGSRIPILPEDHLRLTKPDVVVILPWNLSEEILGQISYVGEWGCEVYTFVTSMKQLL